MLHRPSRLVYVRDGDVVTKSKRSKSESALLLTTEFNYQYRVHDPVWLSYKEPGDDAPKETPVIISGFISPHGRPGKRGAATPGRRATWYRCVPYYGTGTGNAGWD